jgi:hypothetical protein
MPQTSSDTPRDPRDALDRLARDGVVQPPTCRLEDFLAIRGPQRGPVSDAGTRAVQQQRGERV